MRYIKWLLNVLDKLNTEQRYTSIYQYYVGAAAGMKRRLAKHSLRQKEVYTTHIRVTDLKNTRKADLVISPLANM